MALAAQRKGEDRQAVAIIGDGAMTAGMAFEALNNAGVADCNLLVILNDNDMSISPPVGALNRYLAQLMSGQFYAAAKNVGKTVLKGARPCSSWPSAFEEHAKGMVVPATLFEKFGFNYIGPDRRPRPGVADPHAGEHPPSERPAVPACGHARRARATSWPRPTRWPTTGRASSTRPWAWSASARRPSRPSPRCSASGCATWRRRTSAWWASPRPCAKALAWSSSRSGFRAVLRRGHRRAACRHLCRRLACEGLKPVVAIYSTFLQRAYDQLIHDVALQNLPVVFALDRAGLVGADGATHAGRLRHPYLRCIPNMSAWPVRPTRTNAASC
jgi:1-deoxy-D-xylulose-5-phosphate synthase